MLEDLTDYKPGEFGFNTTHANDLTSSRKWYRVAAHR